jgi:argininosuccinate lyase
MDVVTFGRAKREWGSRFTGPFDRLCEGTTAQAMPDMQGMAKVSRVMHAMADALADDGVISADEVERDRAAYEEALDVILTHLRKAGSTVRGVA